MMKHAKNLFFVLLSTFIILSAQTASGQTLPLCSNYSTCSDPQIWLKDCIWDDSCAGTRLMNNVHLDNVIVARGLASLWSPGSTNVTWDFRNVHFGNGICVNVAKFDITNINVKSVSINMHNISMSDCTSDGFWFDLTSSVGAPLHLDVNVSNLKFGDTGIRTRFFIHMVTTNGSTINIEDSSFYGALAINATDIDINLSKVLVYENGAIWSVAPETPAGIQLVSAYRPQNMTNWFGGPVLPVMNAKVLNCQFNISAGLFDTEQGTFYFEHTNFTNLGAAADTFVWKSSRHYPKMVGPPVNNSLPPASPMISTFESHFGNFDGVGMGIITKGQFQLRLFNCDWTAGWIRSAPIRRNDSIDEYLLSAEVRQSKFHAFGANNFGMNLWLLTGAALDMNTYCAGSFVDPETNATAQKQINVQVLVEDTTMEYVAAGCTSDCGSIQWGSISDNSLCQIGNTQVNFRLTHSEVAMFSLERLGFDKGSVTLEIQAPRNNISTIVAVGNSATTMTASNANFYFRDIPSIGAAPQITCLGTGGATCQKFGGRVSNVRWQIENAVMSTVLTNIVAPEPQYQKIAMVLCGMLSCEIDVSGTIPAVPNPNAGPNDLRVRTPFNDTNVYLMVPFTGNSSFTNVNIRFHGQTEITKTRFNLFNPWAPTTALPFENAPRKVLGSIKVDIFENSSALETMFNIATPTYNGITFNINYSAVEAFKIILNESMCDPDNLIPDFPAPEGKWFQLFTDHADLRLGDPEGFPGLVSDYTSCPGQNILISPANSLIQHVLLQRYDVVLYQMMNITAGLLQNREILINMNHCRYNGTNPRMAIFNAVTKGVAEIGSGTFPTTFQFQAIDSVIDLDLPAITNDTMMSNPIWTNPRFVFIENAPGANPVFALNNTEFWWKSGGAVPNMLNNGLQNDNYSESRIIWTGYIPARFVLEGSSITVDGAMMNQFSIFQGKRSPQSRNNFNYFSKSELNVSGDMYRGSISLFFFGGSSSYFNDFSGVDGVSFHVLSSTINMQSSSIRTMMFDLTASVLPTAGEMRLSWISKLSNFSYIVSSPVPAEYPSDGQLGIVDFANTVFASNKKIDVEACRFVLRPHHCRDKVVAFAVSGESSLSNQTATIQIVSSAVQIDAWNTTVGILISYIDVGTPTKSGSLVIYNSKFNATIHQHDVVTSGSPNTLRLVDFAVENATTTLFNVVVNFWFPDLLDKASDITIVNLGKKNRRSAYITNVYATAVAKGIRFLKLNRDATDERMTLSLNNVTFNGIGNAMPNNLGDNSEVSFFFADHINVDVIVTNCHVNLSYHFQGFGFIMQPFSNATLSVNNSVFNIDAFGNTAYNAFLAFVISPLGGLRYSVYFGTGTVINYQAQNPTSFGIAVGFQNSCVAGWQLAGVILFERAKITLGFNSFVEVADQPSVALAGTVAFSQTGSDQRCLNISFINSTITIDDRRTLIDNSSVPAYFFGGANTTEMGNLAIVGNTINVPQYFTWFFSSRIDRIIFDQNTVTFGGIKPAPTAIVQCLSGLPQNCPTVLVVSHNVFRNSVPSLGVVPVTNVDTQIFPPVAGTAAFICNKANGVLWHPPSLLAIGYNTSIINDENCGFSKTRTKSQEILSTTTATNTTTSATTTTTTTTFTSTTPSPTTTTSNSTTAPPTTTTTVLTSSTTASSVATTISPSTIAPPTTTITPAPTVFVNTTVKSQALQEAAAVKEDTTSAVSSVGASAGMLGLASPTLATVAARVGLLTSLASCEADLDNELPRYISPTGLAVDLGAPDVRYHMGANLANLAILVGVGLLSLLFAIVHSACYARPEERRVMGISYRSLGAARFPGCLVFFLLFFSQPFIGSSLTCIFYGNTATACISVFIIVFDLAGGLVLYMSLRNDSQFLATYRTREDLDFDRKMKEREDIQRGVKSKKSDADENQSACERFDKWYEQAIEGVNGFWFDVPRPDEALDFDTREKIDLERIKAHEGHKYFAQRYGAAFDYYQSKYRWFIVLEFVATVVLGICDGLVQVLGCSAVVYILVAIFGIYVFIIFLLRPFCARKDFLFCGVCSLLQFIGGIITVLPASTMDDDKKEEIVTIVCSVALFVGLIQAAEGLLSDGCRFVYEKFCASDDSSEEEKAAAKGIDYNVQTSVASPILRNHSGVYENNGNDNEAPMMIQTSSGDMSGILKMPEHNNGYADQPLSARQKANEYYKNQNNNNNNNNHAEEMHPVTTVSPPPTTSVVGRHQNSTRTTPEQPSIAPPIHQNNKNNQQEQQSSVMNKYHKDDLDEL